MRPHSPTFYSAHKRRANTVFRGDNGLSSAVVEYLESLLVLQFSAASVLFAFLRGSVAKTVHGIVFGSSPLEMLWVKAVAISAGVSRYFASSLGCDNQSDAMHSLFWTVRPLNSTVTMAIERPRPKQAFLGITMFLEHFLHKLNTSLAAQRLESAAPSKPIVMLLAKTSSFATVFATIHAAKSCIISVSHLDTPCCIDVVRRSFGLQSGRPLCILQHGGQ